MIGCDFSWLCFKTYWNYLRLFSFAPERARSPQILTMPRHVSSKDRLEVILKSQDTESVTAAHPGKTDLSSYESM